MQKITRIIFIITTLGFSYISLANYDFEHPDCKIRFIKGKNEILNKVANEVLKKHSFVPQDLVDNRIMIPGDLYFLYTVDYGDKMYKSCTINSLIKVAKARTAQADDRILYKKEIKRTLPRITFKGIERCKKALRETFIHIPSCKPIGFAGEKK